MNSADQVSALEKAILDRARSLAEEHLRQANRSRERIMVDSADRLRLLEEKEVLVAKSKADREFRRRVQASEIRMQAELDRVRWGLVESVLQSTGTRLAELHQDDATYLPVFERLLAEAAAAIERDELYAKVSDQDHRRLKTRWESLAKAAAPNKNVLLSDELCPCSGGVLVSSLDGRIQVDNTFEGRMKRKERELQRVIVERLFPAAAHMGTLFNG